MSINSQYLLSWFTPSYPTGAFAYSHGLEQAIFDHIITDVITLDDWLRSLLEHGSFWNDAILFVQAYKGEDVADLAEALVASKERHHELMSLGASFAKITNEVLDINLAAGPLPVVIAKAAKESNLPLAECLPLFLHSQTANLISVAVRLVPLGQTEGQMLLHSLFPLFEEIAAKAMEADLDDIGASTIFSDIASMRHEDMTTRIFKT